MQTEMKPTNSIMARVVVRHGENGRNGKIVNSSTLCRKDSDRYKDLGNRLYATTENSMEKDDASSTDVK